MHLLSTALVAAASAALPQTAPGSIEAVRGEGTLIVERVVNASGGIETGGATFMLARGSVLIDGGEALGLNGLRVNLTALGLAGAAPGPLVGDLQGTSNITAPEGVVPYEAWLQQNLGHHVSVLAGVYDVNSEFDALDVAGLFLNSSFGIGADFGQSGPNGPSTFPATGLALRLAAAPRPDTRLRVVAADGTPGDPDAPGAVDLGWREGDGVLLVGEAMRLCCAYDDEQRAPQGGRRFLGRGGPGPAPARVGLGGWYYAGVRAAAGAAPARGVYVLGETRFPEGGKPGPTGAFVRIGLADGGAVRAYAGAGLTHAGAPGPAGGHVGLGLAVAWPDPDFLARAGRPVADAAEATLELTYRLDVADWFFVQPDIQVVANPAQAPGADRALVGILRVGLLH